MFVTQKEVCQRLKITPSTHNKLRREGHLPQPFPGLSLYWWPSVIMAIERHVCADVCKKDQLDDKRKVP